MRAYTDWECRLLPMMGELISNPQDSAAALSILKTKFGLTRFCMMPEFDCEKDSVASFLIRREKAFAKLSPLISNEFRIRLGCAALVIPGLSEVRGIKKLLLPQTKFLPIRLPYFPSSETPKELNRLLYHLPYHVLFLSFHSYLNFYPLEDLIRWANLSDVAFHFNYSAMENPRAIDLLKRLLQRNATIIFGTGINSYGKACYYEFDHYIHLASRHFNEYQLDQLFFSKGLANT